MKFVIFNIKRILSKWINFLLFTVPVVATIVFFAIFYMTSQIEEKSTDIQDLQLSNFKLGIVDDDKSEVSKFIIDILRTRYSVRLEEEQEVRQDLIKKQVNYAIIFDENFTENLFSGKIPYLEAIYIKDNSSFVIIQYDIDDLLRYIYSIAKLADFDEAKFWSNIDNMDLTLSFAQKFTQKPSKNISTDTLATFFGFLIFFLIYFNSYFSERVLNDNLSGKTERILSTPYKYYRYIISFFLTQALLGILQIFVVFVVASVFINTLIPIADIAMLCLVLLSANLIGICLGIICSSVAKSSMIFQVLVNTIVIITSMLGGSFWPISIMSDEMLLIGKFIPTFWLNTIVNKILAGKSYEETAIDFIVVLGFAVVIIVISIVFKKISYKKVGR